MLVSGAILSISTQELIGSVLRLVSLFPPLFIGSVVSMDLLVAFVTMFLNHILTESVQTVFLSHVVVQPVRRALV